MRYSVMSFLYFNRQVSVFSPTMIKRRYIYDVETIDEITTSKTVIADGIIMGNIVANYNPSYGSESSIFIPETHRLFNMPLIDRNIDDGKFEGFDNYSTTPDFTKLVKQAIGAKNFHNLTNNLKFSV
jgi:hypothetical protein